MRILSVVLCIAAVVIAVAAGSFVPVFAGPAEEAAAENAAETAGESLIVGVPANRCPIFFQDHDTGEIVGIGVDLMRIAAENAGYTPTFQVVTEDTLKAALDNEAYDVVMPFGSAITSADGFQTIISDNLMQTPFTFVTAGDRDLPSLNALRVGMLHSLGGGIDTLSQLFPEMKVIKYDTMSDCVKALRAGEVDALLHNSYVWSYILQKPSYGDLKIQPEAVFSMDFRAGTLDTPQGQAVIERLNEGIDGIDEAHRQAIILDYTSRKLYRNDFFDYIYRYGLLILLAILLLVSLIVIAVQRVKAVQKAHAEEMRQLLDHDPLTGVLSMNGFRKRVETLLRTHQDAPYFLSYNNIRDFKYINESQGREAGDELLKLWAAKSMEYLSDEEAIGRIEADHFVVLRHIMGDEDMRLDEEKVFEPVQSYFLNQGKENRVQITSGIYVLTPKDFRKIDVDHMVDLARVAEKRVRESRKENFIFYNPEQWDKGRRIADIINYLPKGIRDGDIYVWYQPQIDYKTRKITGAEALCRWDHSKLGWMRPPGFIATLEEAGLIYDLDCFVWERVCQDLQRWNQQGYHRSVSVNVSRDDFQEGRDIPGQFYQLTQTYGLTPDQLRIEITETAYVENPELLIKTTEELHAYGFQVEMDDFGSGYSSLHMLKEVPVDRIKLDLNFLTAAGDQTKGKTIVSCMINMVYMLGMELIAEGVETLEQVDFLVDQGCTEMQGFYFYKPMPVDECEKIMLTVQDVPEQGKAPEQDVPES